MIKPRKKLVTAFSLILISATIVGTASYAWFTMNDKVAAGMDIQAVAAKNLLISETADGAYSTTVDLSDTDVEKALTPCSTADCLNWYAPEGDSGIKYETGAASNETKFKTLADKKGYVRVGKVYVKADISESDTKFKSLYVSDIAVTRGAKESDMIKSLRIGVVCDGNVLIFDYPSLTGSVDTSVVQSLNGDNSAILKSLSSNIIGETAVLAADIGASPKQIDIYLWYEGQDSDCTAHNSTIVENITVSIEFKGVR